MLVRLNANEIKAVATKSANFSGYEIRFKNAKTGADLYAKELPEGMFKLLASKHWAYKHGEKYFFNTKATQKDLKYFTSGQFFADLTGTQEEKPVAKATAKASKPASKTQPKAKKSASKDDLLAQLGKLFSEEQLKVLVAMASK